MDSDLVRRLTGTVLAGSRSLFGRENWNHLRFGTRRGSWRFHIADSRMRILNPLLRRANLAIIPVDVDITRSFDAVIDRWGEDLSFLYNLLDDDASRTLLVELVAFRILGYRQMRLSTNNPSYWAQIRQSCSLKAGTERLESGMEGIRLDHFDLQGIGYPVRLFSRENAVAVQYIMDDYAYTATDPPIRPRPGDCVIDGGAGWGDAALLFALRVGSHGRVFAFEFEPASLNVLERNLSLNPELAERITVVPRALWSKSDLQLAFEACGPGSRIQSIEPQIADPTVEAVTIDDFATEVGRIDFIKMDIEGAEQPALRGGASTIRRDAPKLAISVYHSLDDFCQIPRFLNSLGVSYRFFLKHCTIHGEETVLFATPEA